MENRTKIHQILQGAPGLLLGFVLFFLVGGLRIEAQNAPVVQDLEIRGMELYEPDRIKARMKTEEGKPFSEETLKEDIRRLFDTGYFRNVSWETESLADGVRVIVKIVEENPLIEDIRFEGARAFSDEELQNEMSLRPFQTLQPYEFNEDLENLREKYKEAGYHFVQIKDRLEEGEEGQILTLSIVEGPRVSVEEIEIKGVNKIDPDEIKDIMESEPTWLFGSTMYSEEKVELDLQRIRMFYRGKGYLDVKVNLVEEQFSEDKSEVKLVIRIDEGKQYFINDIRFDGNTVFKSERLKKELFLKPGMKFKISDMQKEVKSLKELYGKNAYIDISVDWEYQLTEEENQVILVYNISEKEKVTAGRVKIQGNTKTRDKVIRRRIRVLPNQPLNRVRIQNSLDRLRATNYFEEVSVEMDDAGEKRKDVTFQVKEGSTGRISLGGAVSSDFGLLGTLRIEQNNFDISRFPDSLSEIWEGTAFAGGGQQFSLNIQPGVDRSTYSMRFREPYFQEQPIGVGGQLFSLDRERTDFREGRDGIRLSGDYRQDKGKWTYNLSLGVENIDISQISPGDPQELQDIRGSSSMLSVTPGLTIDQRDSRLKPSRGYYFNTRLQNSFGDFSFVKLFTDYRKYLTVFERTDGGKHILSGRGRIGVAEGFGSQVPTYDRFFAGGTDTIRGFEYREASPSKDGIDIGGTFMWLANVEYTFPLIRNRGRGQYRDVLRGALFTDLGEVNNDVGQLGDNFRLSVGTGIRFKVPGMGSAPVSLDFAVPITSKRGDNERLIHFNMGASF